MCELNIEQLSTPRKIDAIFLSSNAISMFAYTTYSFQQIIALIFRIQNDAVPLEQFRANYVSKLVFTVTQPVLFHYSKCLNHRDHEINPLYTRSCYIKSDSIVFL